jgi:hypothetical protein
MERSIAFRQRAGIRADEAWVRAVATAPGIEEGIRQFGIPLTPAELAQLQARIQGEDAIVAAVQSYGAEHPEAWAGVYIDRPSGTVVVQVVGDVDEHTAAIRSMIDPGANLEILPARWTLQQLKDLSTSITHGGWLYAQGYDLLDLGYNLKRNLVELVISSNDPDDVARIERHYDVGPMLTVSIDGTGVTSLPTGTLRGRAIGADGQPVAGLDVELVGAMPGSGPRSDIGQETDAHGTFSFPDVTATEYQIRLLSNVSSAGTVLEGADRIEVGSGHAVVEPGGATFVTIVTIP